MADPTSPEQPNQPNPDLVNAIRVHRQGIKARLPRADNVLKKSGKTEDSPGFNREKINFAGELLRESLESEKDPLTGFNNRKGWDRKVNEEFERSAREKTTSALILFDANNLKVLNDTQGYQAGDAYLKLIADCLDEATRAVVDTVARWGGDEFGVVLHNTTIEGVKAWWLRAQKILADHGISIGGGVAMIDPQRLINRDSHPKTAEEINVVKSEIQEQATTGLHKAKLLSKEDNTCVLDIPNQLAA